MAAEPRPPLGEQYKLIGLTQETTSGTYATVSTPLAAVCFDIKCDAGDFFADGERRAQGNYVGTGAAVKGKIMGKYSFKMWVAPGGPLMLLLTGAGYALGGGSYKPVSSLANRKTWSVRVWEDGRVKKIAGGVHNVKFLAEDGKPLVAEFSGEGVWYAVEDEAMPAQSPVLTTPYVCTGVTPLIAAATPARFNKWEVDLGAKPAPLLDMDQTQGVAYFIHESIDPTITIDTEARKVADQDAYGLLLAGTTQAVSLAFPVSGSGTLTISAPAAQRMGITEGVRKPALVDELKLNCHVSSGDDALAIAEAT